MGNSVWSIERLVIALGWLPQTDYRSFGSVCGDYRLQRAYGTCRWTLFKDTELGMMLLASYVENFNVSDEDLYDTPLHEVLARARERVTRDRSGIPLEHKHEQEEAQARVQREAQHKEYFDRHRVVSKEVAEACAEQVEQVEHAERPWKQSQYEEGFLAHEWNDEHLEGFFDWLADRLDKLEGESDGE